MWELTSVRKQKAPDLLCLWNQPLWHQQLWQNFSLTASVWDRAHATPDTRSASHPGRLKLSSRLKPGDVILLTQSSSSSYHGGCWMLPAAGWTVCSSPTSLFFPSLFPSSLPRPPPPLCARAQTEQHQHCCPHLLCPPALCSMFTHWRVRLSRLGPHQTQTHSFSHCPSFFHSCQQNSTAAHFFSCFSCFWHKTLEFLSLPLSLSRRLLSSSCQVDISFISQEVFDRPFYEEMYPPAAPIATAQLQYIFPSRTDSHRRFNFHPFFSLHHSSPFHFTLLSFFFVLLFFVVFNKNILQCLEQHLEERLSLYFVSSLW